MITFSYKKQLDMNDIEFYLVSINSDTPQFNYFDKILDSSEREMMFLSLYIENYINCHYGDPVETLYWVVRMSLNNFQLWSKISQDDYNVLVEKQKNE